MEFELPAQKSQEVRVGTGQALRATCITLCTTAAVAALCVGAFRLGVETASAGIYERQIAKAEAQNAGLMRLVGIVDEAKAREFASCVQAGAAGCESIIAPVVAP